MTRLAQAFLSGAVLLLAVAVLVKAALPDFLIFAEGTRIELSCSPDVIERLRPTDTP